MKQEEINVQKCWLFLILLCLILEIVLVKILSKKKEKQT